MFLLSLPFTLVHHTITYLYPLYASYKAISSHHSNHNHNTHQHGSTTSTSTSTSTVGGGLMTKSVTGEQRTEMAELESWLMYWSVVGAIHILEGWGEWAWSWLPFYSLAKLAFTLWLVLPQTRGATILYTNYLGPFLDAHEGDIDIALSSAKRRASETAGEWILLVWQQIRSAILGAAMSPDPSSSSSAAGPEPGPPTQTPPTLHNPASGTTSQLINLFKHYGPLTAAGVVSMMDKAAAHAAHATGTQPPRTTDAQVEGYSTGVETRSGGGGGGGGGGSSSSSRIPTTRSRSHLTRPTTTNAAAAAGSTMSVGQKDSKVAPNTSGSDWSEEDDSREDEKERLLIRKRVGGVAAASTGAGMKQDLSGSYQIVDEVDEVGLPQTGSRSSGGSTSGQSVAGTAEGKGWAAWLTGR